MYFQSLGKIKKKHSPSTDHPNSVSRIRGKRKKERENKKVTGYSSKLIFRFDKFFYSKSLLEFNFLIF